MSSFSLSAELAEIMDEVGESQQPSLGDDGHMSSGERCDDAFNEGDNDGS